MSQSQITNPNSYTLRDVLLLSQLLHINHISNLDKLEKIDNALLVSILSTWKTHISTKLDHSNIKINTLNQLIDLYKKLLAKYNVENTESLANEVYFTRIDELEDTIAKKKIEFRNTLEEE
ncbi:uncharacterized protein KGF55_002663 [Candida pseudojiufengensis]|uniref:uncharacterized protein n=1 Tax=Candida pseudojiufengensis TaxID=497109 RepID=UPI0022247748|nr:uncharacterized protein KGF55_002663 [Candida pseudojiufengensis]KAI5963783.1 hypothetical protein KGF55_002663 [Candida pseudojiufengensis]